MEKDIFVFKNLKNCSHVFLPVDAVKPSLHPPYTGTYTVLKRGEQTFTLIVNGKENTVSIDRLKPAHLVVDSVTPSKVLGSTSTDGAVHRTVTEGSDATTATPSPRAAATSETTYGKSTASSDAATSTSRTRAGRHLHFPKRYEEYALISL
ncbi:hypothetical protein AVEN_272264-1 [Araneus ventricosus]|uniref:Uncharacterized protein n=1 Tax=Araneus ventricosus TaxID=182803 RepID=A0A4Y2MDN6_ARAVE|nr:hypothetical protein AVEN_272264-1 [Araneus ventricosus]